MTQNRFDTQTPEFISLQIPDLNPQPDASVESALTPDPSPPNANSDFFKKIRPSEAVLIVVGILIAVTRLTLALSIISINDIRSLDWSSLKTLKRVGCPAVHIIGFCLLGLRHYVKQLEKRTSWIITAINNGTDWIALLSVMMDLYKICQNDQNGLEIVSSVANIVLVILHVGLVKLGSKVIGKPVQEQADVDNLPERQNEV